jgi:Zn-dependent protease with chaperone function
VVIFALWAEHFDRHLVNLAIKNPKFDRTIETEKIRVGSLCVILFQFTLFIGSYELRHEYPFYSQLIFCTTVLLQMSLQSRLEKKLLALGAKSDNLIALLTKGFISWLFGAVFYIATVFASIRGAMWATEKFHLSTNTGVFLFFMSGILGIMGGLLANFAIAPFALKKVFPSTEDIDDAVKTEIESSFKKASLPVPKLSVIELHQYIFVKSMVAGYQRGRWVFKPTLFLARPLLSSLSKTEIQALVYNHISHLALKHFRKKFLLSFSLILLTTFVALLSIYISRTFLSEHNAFEIVGPAFALASFFTSFKILTQQIKSHQTEADLYTLEKFGVEFEDFAKCLKKLDRPKDPKALEQPLYPDTERRLEQLKSALDSKKDVQAQAS